MIENWADNYGGKAMKDVFKGAREVLWVNIGERGYGGKFDDIEDGVRGEI